MARKEISTMTDQALPIINHNKCTVCGTCIKVCPESVLAIQDGRLAIANPKACTYCGTCEENCPEGAVRLEYLIRWA